MSELPSDGGFTLQAGAAQECITPPLGTPIAGYYHERLATGVHDDLFAKALYLSDGATELAWAVCDLIAVNRATVEAARRAIAERTGLAAEHVLISATHAHTGPRYFGPHPGVYDEGPEKLTEAQRDYLARLVDATARAVVRARASARHARLELAVAHEDSLSFNRRFHMRNGKVWMNPGKCSPDIIRSAGPIDPRVAILAVRDGENGAPLAALVNFALHLDTIGGTEFSADYPHFLGRRLRASLGGELICIFAQGCAGDLNHFDVSSPVPQQGFDEAERIGTRLAEDVLGALHSARPLPAGPLGAASARLSLPLQTYAPGDLAAARAIIAAADADFVKQARAYKVLQLAQLNRPTLEVEVQALRIGELAIVGLPGEIFVELGLWIREHSPFPTTLVVELANDSIGYVPTRKAFAEGSYEVTNSLIAPGAGEQMAETAIELLRCLERGPQ